MRLFLKKVWTLGYIHNYIPIVPRVPWLNVWYLIFFIGIGIVGSTVVAMGIRGRL
jgi:hypothetical protein